jgi:putative aldouronate transport system substrate-binding protein
MRKLMVAVVFAVLMFAVVGGLAAQDDLPVLVYYFPGSAQPDLAMVQEALSAYMAERIGATIELRPIDWGAYDSQISLMNAAGEEYDLAFTAPWINNFLTNVSEEYLLPLTDLLPEYAPNYFASMTPATWDAVTVGGEIMAGINQQIFVKPFGPYIRADVLDAIGMADEFNALTSFEDLGPILEAIQAQVDADTTDPLEYVTFNLSGLSIPEIWGYDPQDSFLAVKTDDETAQVVIWPQTDEYRQAVTTIREYYQAGYAPTDVANWAEADSAWTAGQYGIRLVEIVKPGGEAETEARWGQPVVATAIAEPVLTTGGVIATLTGVSSTSQHPELAVQYLELVNTDPVFFNMLAKGLEGTHWEWADQDLLLIQPANGAASFGDTGYNPNSDWMFGNVFNAFYSDPTQVGAWPETAELNASARPSPLLGFTFDRSAVETEMSSISAVGSEFADPLNQGIIETEEGLAALNQALIDAGIERVQAEMQRQVDEWLAAKNS